MVIGIDASRLENNNKTGTENYAQEVITRLISADKNDQYILYSRKPLDLSLPKNCKNKVLKFPLFWTQVRLSLEMLFNSPDVLFIPAHTVPLIHPKKTVTVIHGLEYEYFPEAYSVKERIKNKLGNYFSAKLAKVVVVPSKNTKNDLTKLYKIAPEKIKVIYPGVDNFGINNDKEIVRNNTDKLKPYLLFIGRIEYRKNLTNIIKAFEKVKKERKIPHKLILAGKDGYGAEEIKNIAKKSEFKKEIIFTGYVKDKEKNDLLKNPSLFIFPTFYEGFGFPVLEAMSSGVPVVTSDQGSLPEVAGNAAVLVNPHSIDEIADSIYKIITDNSLARGLVEKGYQNVARFNWDKCAKYILDIFQSF